MHYNTTRYLKLKRKSMKTRTNLNPFHYLSLPVILLFFGCTEKQPVEWVSSTETGLWEKNTGLYVSTENSKDTADVTIFTDKTLQTIDGFGACFNELGWTSLSLLSETDRNNIMDELFTANKGANFKICRTPIGANDFSRNWYSYDETDGDFEMNDFSIANDEETLIPFILTAKKYNPDLKVWASPWSPPAWMKYNKHYACRPDPRVNDLKGDPSTDLEGSNMFIQKDEYMKAYALYFGKYIDAYAEKGIDIYGVAPQNEFNSCQNFPSCTWLPSGLAKFIGQFLGPEMEKRNKEIIFATMERPNVALIDTILNDPTAKKYITGIGFQWAGKGAVQDAYKKYPDLKMYQTEQECGDGKNDLKGAAYSWNLMNHYLTNGTNIYDYWNISLEEGGISRWGWAQNSLVIVDPETKTYEYTLEYYVMKHHSHYILPGAKRLETSAYENLMAFKNPDNGIVIVVGNFSDTEKLLTISIDNKTVSPTLKPNSLNTFLIK